MQVSIIIPTYNSAAFVGEAITSALDQRGVEREIILVDNNSTDQTLEVLESWRAKYPADVQVHQATRQGPSAARNVGLQHAKGTWIQFLDADDLIPPDKLIRQLSLANEASWVAASFTEIDLKGNTTELHITLDPWRGLAIGTGIGCICSNVFRLATLRKIGFFNESLLTAEDHELYFRLLAAGFPPKIDSVSRCLVRDRPSNKQSRLDPANQLLSRIHLHQKIHLFLLANQPEYYRENGDFLRATLLNNFRYWAHFNRIDAVKLAVPFFKLVGGIPNSSHGIMPFWIHLLYRTLGFRRVEWLRELTSAK